MALILDGTTGIVANNISSTSRLAVGNMATGSVLQAVTYGTSTGISTTSTSPQATGMSVTITPTSASSKMLIFYSLGDVSTNGWTSGGNGGIVVWIYKNGSALTKNANQWNYTNGGGGYKIFSGGSVSYDSPNTTSATTYAIYWAVNTGSTYTAELFRDATAGSLIVMEIAA